MPVACPEGIEPPTHSLEGCCSIQLSYGQIERKKARKAFDGYLMVGAIGFEPTTLWSQTRCATRLRYTEIKLAPEEGVEPSPAVLETAVLP